MILIRHKSDNVIWHEFEDSDTVTMDSDGVTSDNWIAAWATPDDFEIVTGVDANPDGKGYFRGYSFDGTTWTEVDASIRIECDRSNAVGEAAIAERDSTTVTADMQTRLTELTG